MPSKISIRKQKAEDLGSNPGSCILPMKTTYQGFGRNNVSKSVKIGARYAA